MFEQDEIFLKSVNRLNSKISRWKDEKMIDDYIRVYKRVWLMIDGEKSVRALCRAISSEMNMDTGRSDILVSLTIVGLSRNGAVRSAK